MLSVVPAISYEDLMGSDIDSRLITLPEFEKEFNLPDQELAQRHNLEDPNSTTRLSVLYKLHVEETGDEFTEYLNTLPLDLAVTIFNKLRLRNETPMQSYFAQRMPVDDVINYVRYLTKSDLTDNIMNPVFVAAMQCYTKNYDEEIVNQLLELMEEYDDTFQWLDYISAVVPYGPDWMLEEFSNYDDDGSLELIYDAALENDKERLSYVIDYISKDRDYENQLRAYARTIEDVEAIVPANYGTIVMTLAKKLNKSLVDLDLVETTFQTWKLKVLNDEV